LGSAGRGYYQLVYTTKFVLKRDAARRERGGGGDRGGGNRKKKHVEEKGNAMIRKRYSETLASSRKTNLM